MRWASALLKLVQLLNSESTRTQVKKADVRVKYRQLQIDTWRITPSNAKKLHDSNQSNFCQVDE